ncbi:hypothetical protein PCASD_15928 [Puccinia coronata f. sp. avenae]|uniref:Uncharacterized protein n=1 Tax=Puccinia coronata f. sp. avenae TaxID=200324 RepID=A0A2N5UEW4_9BASI|nr:hypothetical protein PCASD_15928 [Puccinia coronata f. sp. avenae]
MKNKTKPDQLNNSNSGSIIDLRKDSDAENAKINIRKNPNDKKKYDSILEFFGEPFYPDKALAEERKKAPITFHCKWCKKTVCGGYNSNANLRKHQDGSNQVGRDREV